MEKYGNLIQSIELFELFSFADKVYGPYKRPSDGRSIVIVIDDKGNRNTISYPKYLMEKHLGRKLDKDLETVDHWDSNIDNNSIDNLRIVPRKEHSSDDTRRVVNLKLNCAVCSREFERSPRLVRDKSKKGKTSAFCSRECAGKYSREVQLGLRDKMPPSDAPKSEYYKRKYVNAFLDYLEIKYA